ncbi:MAG: hypothetical protein ACU843_10160 [Gammaproteobacteria bacterium]
MKSFNRHLVSIPFLLPAMVGVFTLARADTGPVGFDDADLLFVPLRWCVIQGSPAATSPRIGSVPATTDQVILQRMATVNDRVWTPGANISFRSAMPASGVNLTIPVIADPFPPGSTGVGSGSASARLGDIDYGCYQPPASGSTSNQCEKDIARSACRAAWNAYAAQLGVSIQGPIAINFSNFTDSTGIVLSTTGQGLWYKQSSGAVCASNWTIYNGNYGDNDVVYITDNQTHPEANERSLAHELGHVLFLSHGNGTDTDGDGLSRTCDGGWGTNSTYLPSPPAEPYLASPGSIMVQTPYSASLYLSPNERFISRKYAYAIPGVTYDPPAVLIDGPVVGSSASDPANDVTDIGADLVAVGAHKDTAAATTNLTFSLSGLGSADSEYEYNMLLDLDNDSSTGGSSAEQGLGAGFEGAELIVTLTRAGDTRSVAVEVFQGGSFVPVQDDRITTQIADNGELNEDPENGTPPPSPSGDIPPDVSIVTNTGFLVSIPTDLLPPAADLIRFQAFALSRTDNISTALDLAPDSGPGDSLRLTAPIFPVASVEPVIAERGQTVTVSATGQPPGRAVGVYVGTKKVADAVADEQGNVATSFVVADGSSSGARSFSVRSGNVTAETSLGVHSDTRIDALPAEVVPAREPGDQGREFDVQPKAVLTDAVTLEPVLGRTVNFSTAGHPLCSAVSDDDGVATCTATISESLHEILGRGYVAEFAGDAFLNPTQDQGSVIGIGVGTPGR